MKKKMNLPCLAALLLTVTFAAFGQDKQTADQKSNPMKKSELVKALEANALSSKELVQRIEQRGVDFQSNEEIEQELKDAGASREVIAAARANYRAAPKKKGLFGKLGDGLNKAAAAVEKNLPKTSENAETKSPTVSDQTNDIGKTTPVNKRTSNQTTVAKNDKPPADGKAPRSLDNFPK